MKDNPTILGIGTDIIEIERIAMVYERHGKRFLDRIFTKNEQEYALRKKRPEITLAGRFAAKEAVAKVLGTGIRDHVGWKDIEIINDPLGKPLVILSDALKVAFPNLDILVSISHSKVHAIAFALSQKL